MQHLFDLLRRLFGSDGPNSTSVHKMQSFNSFLLNDCEMDGQILFFCQHDAEFLRNPFQVTLAH
jgi:hypothetical protein